ncbi:hypothetical protein ACFVVL_09955 [Kitasatospora sp. NPDC058115]|uniref:hypothetical protein n=1 Tax=Kitasatospora sp. NPDC058115 TaxID=3346347 RepID=UPI0036DB6F54
MASEEPGARPGERTGLRARPAAVGARADGGPAVRAAGTERVTGGPARPEFPDEPGAGPAGARRPR